MKQHEQILVKHRLFIENVALRNLTPQRGNDWVMEILDAYKLIDNSVEVLSECATCNNIYTASFKIIYAYCESVNWFTKGTNLTVENITEALSYNDVRQISQINEEDIKKL